MGAIAIVTALGGAAAAGPKKPTAAEARKTAEAWRDALGGADDPPSPELIALTAIPFRAYVWDDYGSGPDGNGEMCKDAVATDPAAVSSSLQCVQAHAKVDGEYKAWSKKVAREDGIPGGFKKDLRTLAKSSTLVMFEVECAGDGNQLVLAVSRGTDGKLGVGAVFASSLFCGE